MTPIDRDLARVRWLARVLDTRFRLPGTSIRFGYDPIIGILPGVGDTVTDRKSTRLNSSHVAISYAVFCLDRKSVV